MRKREPYVRGMMSNRGGLDRRWNPHVDPLAVARAVSGDRPRVMHKVDRDAAIDALDKKGWSARAIAIHIRVTARTVTRRRAARRIEETTSAQGV